VDEFVEVESLHCGAAVIGGFLDRLGSECDDETART
jgi:hypothetical protein